MAVVGLFKGLGVILLYAMLSTAISFFVTMVGVIIICKLRRGKELPDSFYDGSVKSLFWGAIIALILLISFGPYHFLK